MGYQIYLSAAKIQETASERIAKKNVVFTKDGMRVGVKQMKNENYVDATQSWVVKAWNLGTATGDDKQKDRFATRSPSHLIVFSLSPSALPCHSRFFEKQQVTDIYSQQEAQVNRNPLATPRFNAAPPGEPDRRDPILILYPCWKRDALREVSFTIHGCGGEPRTIARGYSRNIRKG